MISLLSQLTYLFWARQNRRPADSWLNPLIIEITISSIRMGLDNNMLKKSYFPLIVILQFVIG